MGLVSFPAHALLIVEERLRADQRDGLLAPDADVTELALKILVLAEHSRRTTVRVSKQARFTSAPT
jgi:hypothetical protein